ncbi:Phosphatidate cytidylyltransferase [Kalmanozyma brasiliensis GHG001]|uniref:Phosphatidate cytidylyltransferase n=1 Tax=Kalmanozyma brasiliensis (strain GHG001) TaxID=1365824 RepID=V5EFJ7_KALBG|nr:Phosphatidate cytidylyltransferase [Kalmanozyma brasiliensis GHG001]EST09271.1 Phosphatidate cytidylyltransferase [Kalmanozyma brasiliensis GHG001]
MSTRSSKKVVSDSPASSPPPTGSSSASQNGSTTGTRRRSSSLQKGAAVLRALSRAESDFDRDMLEQSSALQTEDDAKSSAISANGNDGSELRRRPQAVQRASSSKSTSNGHVASAESKSWEIPRKVFHSSMGLLVLQLYFSKQDYTTVARNLSIFLGIVVTADVIRLNNPAFERFYERVLGFLMRESEKDKVNGVVWYLIGVISSLHFFPEDIACVSVMILSWCDTSASLFGRLFGKYTPPLPHPPFARRKSTAGFLAAVVTGALTAYLFWCTPIAMSNVRPRGISWSGQDSRHPAIFGTNRVAGAYGTGWEGFSVGFRGQSHWGLLPGVDRLSAIFLGGKTAADRALGADTLPNPHKDVPGMPWWMLCLGSGLVAGVAEGLEIGGMDDNLTLPILAGLGLWAMFWGWGRLGVVLLHGGDGGR